MAFKWDIEKRAIKPNSRQGRTAVLFCVDTDTGERLGHCYVETWLYGCALGGLSNLNSLGSVPLEAFDSFKKFLTSLSCSMNDEEVVYHTYKCKRYMFTVASMPGNFGKHMAANSELVKEFENWAHTSATNKMYFLNLGKAE
jgi:hypothetical protein